MNTAARLGTYGAGLVVIFTGSFAAGSLIIPDGTVAAWRHSAEAGRGEHGSMPSSAPAVRGLSLSQDDLALGPVAAPTAVGRSGTLSFTVRGADGQPFTDFATPTRRSCT